MNFVPFKELLTRKIMGSAPGFKCESTIAIKFKTPPSLICLFLYSYRHCFPRNRRVVSLLPALSFSTPTDLASSQSASGFPLPRPRHPLLLLPYSTRLHCPQTQPNKPVTEIILSLGQKVKSLTLKKYKQVK